MNPINLRGVVHKSIKHDAACSYQVTLQIFLLAYSLGIYCDCCHKLDLFIHQKFGKIEQCMCEWQKITALWWWLIEKVNNEKSTALHFALASPKSVAETDQIWSFWSLEIWRSTLSENHNKVFLKSKCRGPFEFGYCFGVWGVTHLCQMVEQRSYGAIFTLPVWNPSRYADFHLF